MNKLSPKSQRNQPRSRAYEALWRLAEIVFVSNPLQVSTRLRVAVLRAFGATIGSDCVIRPIRVHYPWNLHIGSRCWIGERAWFHNQASIVVGPDSVISQECMITTGSHNLSTMDLITEPITIGAHVWITSRVVVTLGVTIGDGVVVTPGSIVFKSLPGIPGKRAIYGGNPIKQIHDVEVE